jgi:ABC-type transport system substrate-binding protein
LIDQLKEIWIDGELEPVETANWFPKLAPKDYQIGLNNTGSGVDDPDQQFFENYGCGSERNYTATATRSWRSCSSSSRRWPKGRSAGASSIPG